jgi:hypothetical protein
LTVFGSALADGAQEYLYENSVAWRVKMLRDYKYGATIADIGWICGIWSVIFAVALLIVVVNLAASNRMNAWLVLAVALVTLSGIASYFLAYRCGAELGERLSPRMVIPPGLGYKDLRWIPSKE